MSRNIFIMLLICLILTNFTIACGQVEKEARTKFNEAILLKQYGKLNEALDVLIKIASQYSQTKVATEALIELEQLKKEISLRDHLSQQALEEKKIRDLKDIKIRDDKIISIMKDKIMAKARDVALQCEIYLRCHPDLEREDFSYDPEFNGIAVQSLGQSGYTCFIQQPEPDKGQNWTFWAHPNPNIVGIDDIDMIRKALGPYFDHFFKIWTGAQGMKESEGFYRWKDPDGNIREKYMAISPILLEGLPFLLMSTAYIDEYVISDR